MSLPVLLNSYLRRGNTIFVVRFQSLEILQNEQILVNKLVKIRTGVTNIGKSSFNLKSQFFVENNIFATLTVIVVTVCTETGKSKEISSAVRADIEKQLIIEEPKQNPNVFSNFQKPNSYHEYMFIVRHSDLGLKITIKVPLLSSTISKKNFRL